MALALQQLINGLTLGAVYGLIAIGYTMVYGIIGMINFAHGDIYMVSAFIAITGFTLLTAFGVESVAFALLVVLKIGAMASNFVGNRLVTWWHALLHRIPVVRSIYSGVKQVSDTLFSEKGNAFRKALLVEWPHQGMWTIGFLTGNPAGDVLTQLQAQPGAQSASDEFLSVFVPTTPNPTGGYFVMVRRSACQELSMSVDEALTYIVSMGVIVPGSTKRPLAKSLSASAAAPLP